MDKDKLEIPSEQRPDPPADEQPIPVASYSADEEWVKQHKKDFAEEPSFF